jgi:hypothetical protein
MNIGRGSVTIRTFGATLARGLRTRVDVRHFLPGGRQDLHIDTHWNRVSILCSHYIGVGPRSALSRNNDHVNSSSDDVCPFTSRARGTRGAP